MAGDVTGPQRWRFLFTCAGGLGHLHPLVPLARALVQAGHAVAFAVGPFLRPVVEAAGFVVFPLVSSRTQDPEYLQVRAELDAQPVTLATELYAYPRLFGGIAARLRTPEMVAIAQAWHPDLLIREAAEYSTVIAAEHLGLPHVTVAFATALRGMTLFERELAPQLDPVRRQWGLALDPGLTALNRYLHLSYAPPSFALADPGGPGAAGAIPPTTHFLQPAIFDQAEPAGLPAWVAQLPAQPTVYVTLGTEVNTIPEFYPSVLQTIIAGLRDAPINVIVTLGRDKDPADFGPQPANVHVARYIPQSLLLPHCDLMVMHGGSNSLLAALDVGLPLVVVPLIADQFFNAHVTQRQGLGRVVPLGELTPARIRAAVEDVLAQPRYRQTVGRLHAELHALPGQAHAVALVETVAATRAPVRGPDLPARP